MSQTLISPQRPGHDGVQSVIIRRCFAFMLDFIFMAILGWGLFFAITIFGFLTFGFGWVAFHILPWLPFIYYILFIAAGSATPGQRITGIAVRQASSLALPTLAQALVWSLGFWFSLALAGLPFLLAFFNPHRRCTHDVLSGLVFVRLSQF